MRLGQITVGAAVVQFLSNVSLQFWGWRESSCKDQTHWRTSDSSGAERASFCCGCLRCQYFLRQWLLWLTYV